MFEAAASVDSGPVYAINEMRFSGHELVDELRAIQASKVAELVTAFVSAYPNVTCHPQLGTPSSYPKRRGYG